MEPEVSNEAMAALRECYGRHWVAGLQARVGALRTMTATTAVDETALRGDHIRDSWRRERASILKRFKLPSDLPTVEDK